MSKEMTLADERQLTFQQIRDLVSDLEGTCNSIEHALSKMGYDDISDPYEWLSLDELNELDALVFRCTNCSWWFEVCDAIEVGEDMFCEDCAEKETAENE